ncbi:FecR family protein [Chitinophaga arvensicola]|uniref:Ferric-dicitrate binding protein FerR, regulates iron transport through sigma-19 n=1 Tax=Chitinophaga arvensicola TaxID=29529 RepID=A0A1I0RW79_9BACT|nr:FecR domain-containing protein [Chitinophaga arvensicola]SEW45617.1 ferric-dicitrate binding protein FerR, regulates iron transport through sigma-19 [Chitinophaga arvensicola]
MELHELQQIIHKYRQGTATPAEIRLVETWLLQTGSEATWSSPTERDVTEARILSKLRTGIAITPKVRRPYWQHPLIRIAAMFILFAGISYTTYQYRYHLLDYLNPVERLTVSTGAYDIKQVVLPDSTLITLAPHSRLTYPGKYRGPKREVTLNGKGYFSVTRNQQQPFWVHTESIDIHVLGTSFVVNDQLQDSTAAVSVLTGKVNVSHQQEFLAILTPNKGVRFNKSTGKSSIREVDAAMQTNWINKRLVFETTPLTEVLKTLQDHYHIVIQSTVELENGKVFTGTFTTTDSLTDMLDIITISTGLKYQPLNHHTIKLYR